MPGQLRTLQRRVKQWRAQGRVELGSTRFRGRIGLRAAFANWRTGASDLSLLMEALRAAASCTLGRA